MPAKARRRKVIAQRATLGLSSHALLEFQKKILERMREKKIMWAEAEKEILEEMKKLQK